MVKAPAVCLLLAALAMGLPVQGQTPGKQADASGREIAVYSRSDLSSQVDATGEPLLRRPALAPGTGTLDTALFPAQHLDLPAEQDVEAMVIVALDADGQPQHCRGSQQQLLLDRTPQTAEVLPEALAASTCAIAIDRLDYRRALTQTGTGAPAELAVVVRYGWQRPMLPPPPNPPASWVAYPGWNSQHFAPWHLQNVILGSVDGAAFLPEDRQRPRRAEVGVLFSRDAEGTVTDCRVIVPSGIAAYDDASCPALVATRVAGDQWARSNLPVMLRWNRQQARMESPVAFTGPEFTAPVTPDAGLVAGIDPSSLSEVAAELWVSPDGSLRACRVSWPSYNDALDLATCAAFAGAQFTRPRGVFGEPAEGRLDMWVNWRRLSLRRRGR